MNNFHIKNHYAEETTPKSINNNYYQYNRQVHIKETSLASPIHRSF